MNIWETSKVLKLKNSNLSSTSFSTPFLTCQKCPTMSPHPEAVASSTSSLIWELKEFTTVVESPTRPWSSLNCFEATPSIHAMVWNRYEMCAIMISVAVPALPSSNQSQSRFGKSTHIFMISNSVTHLHSNTNFAIAGNSARVLISQCRAPMSPRQVLMSTHREPISSHRISNVRMFRDVSQCFKSVLCFTMF